MTLPRKKALPEGALCSIPKCPRKAKYAETGWCQTHYHRWWRTGSPHGLKQERGASGPGAVSWQGDDVTYFGAHGRVKVLWGSASRYPCIACAKSADDWAYDGTDPTERSGLVQGKYPVTYSAWPEFYMPMCTGCHAVRDAEMRPQIAHCKRGHEFTVENTYWPPSKPGTRECRTCRKENSARRYQARKNAAKSPTKNRSIK